MVRAVFSAVGLATVSASARMALTTLVTSQAKSASGSPSLRTRILAVDRGLGLWARRVEDYRREPDKVPGLEAEDGLVGSRSGNGLHAWLTEPSALTCRTRHAHCIGRLFLEDDPDGVTVLIDGHPRPIG